jgi:predicted RNA-binding Zn ribbon-like protein
MRARVDLVAGGTCLPLGPVSGRCSHRRRGGALRCTSIEVLLGHLARVAIALLTGPERTSLHRCEHPACEMLFVRQHHRRRLCSAGCSHRFRQYRYNRTKTSDHAATDRRS